MGEKRRKREIILAGDPICYFCSIERATTIDHVPARVCFKNKIGPEGYEFPACSNCNSADRQVEQAVGFLIRMGDQSEIAPDNVEFERLFRGVANNAPHLLPAVDLPTRSRRQAMKRLRPEFWKGLTSSEVPVAELPAETTLAFKRFGNKLCRGLFYKHFKNPAPKDAIVRTQHIHYSEIRAEEIVRKFESSLPHLEVTQRKNTSIGNQFAYRWHGEASLNAFAFVAQFSQSFFFYGLLARPDIFSEHVRDIVERSLKEEVESL